MYSILSILYSSTPLQSLKYKKRLPRDKSWKPPIITHIFFVSGVELQSRDVLSTGFVFFRSFDCS